jgi:hypothetical protein
MGLDMYLTGKRYLSKHFNKGDDVLAEAIAEQFPELKGKVGHFGDASCIKEIRMEAGYWRKANAIHDWFVKNVQGGEDECQPHDVSREQLQELKEVCERVIAFHHLATDLLPPTAGFFFGTAEVDDYYWEYLQNTVDIIDRCLELPKPWDFEYCSSW